MFELVYGWATPELKLPMFGDTRRQPAEELPWHERLICQRLLEGAELFDGPRFRARGNADLEPLPACASFAWREAGLYVMRSDWGPEQICFAFHDSPPARAIAEHYGVPASTLAMAVALLCVSAGVLVLRPGLRRLQ